MELTYIGPESVGPHYFESGKRPAGDAQMIPVSVQGVSGKVYPAMYLPAENCFIDEHSIVMNIVCWWHLPAAAPSTEREWFLSCFETWEPATMIQAEKNGVYYAYYAMDEFFLSIAGDLVAAYDTIEEAKEAAYQHWVEAGRP